VEGISTEVLHTVIVQEGEEDKMKQIIKIVIMSISLSIALNANVQHFKNINDAVNSFVKALQTKDKTTLEALFTKKYQQILHVKQLTSEDVTAFLNAYKKKHTLVSFDAKHIYIAVGVQQWTFPIPLIKSKAGWYYDLDLGIQNMTTRTIGANELAIIRALANDKTLQELQESELSDIYTFVKEHERIFAMPKEYAKTGIMSFYRNKIGEIFEANMTLRESFKQISTLYISQSKE